MDVFGTALALDLFDKIIATPRSSELRATGKETAASVYGGNLASLGDYSIRGHDEGMVYGQINADFSPSPAMVRRSEKPWKTRRIFLASGSGELPQGVHPASRDLGEWSVNLAWAVRISGDGGQEGRHLAKK